jgi:putative DNA primase/helicase
MPRTAHRPDADDVVREQVENLDAENGFTDTYGADRFIGRYGNDWRFDHDRQLWLTFREADQRWRRGRPGEVDNLAIERAQDFLRAIQTAPFPNDRVRERARTWGRYCQQLRGINSVLGVTQKRPPIAVTSKDWNTDPWLVRVPNGIIDLRAGKLLQASRDHLISLSLGVHYDSKATCPRWVRFLNEIFEADDLLVAYLQRVLGYVLTGSTHEQVWWLLHGEGSNGKTVLLNIVTYVLGEYAKTVSFSMFVRANRPSVGDGTEGLVDMRFLSAREAMEGARLDEARMKAFTGSDPIPARPLYCPIFEFDAKFKLFLCANHMPVATDNSHAFWRRVHLIPFLHCFIKRTKEHDENLEPKLKAEGPGILAWMVKGCLQWQRLGQLHPPSAVTDATTEYQTESDRLGSFLDECCEPVADATCPASALFKKYQRWADAQQIPDNQRLNATTFGTRMKQKFDRAENSKGRFYKGLRLKPGGGSRLSTFRR